MSQKPRAVHKHIRTKPYTPKTTKNQWQEPAPAQAGAERLIQTAVREWAYAQAYPTSQHRHDALPAWLHRYLKSQTPISRFGLAENNLLRLHS